MLDGRANFHADYFASPPPMSLKARLRRQLIAARERSERLLADFRTPDDWVYQVHACANHALWFAGHMAVTDNFFVGLIEPSRAVPMDDFSPLFGVGSQPVADAAHYPPAENVLARMRQRRQALLEILSTLDDAALSEPTPQGTPDFLSDKASVFETAIWHEGMHSGQLSVVRRALGHEPLS